VLLCFLLHPPAGLLACLTGSSTTNLHTTPSKPASSFYRVPNYCTQSSFLIGSHCSIASEHAILPSSPQARATKYARPGSHKILRGYSNFMYTKHTVPRYLMPPFVCNNAHIQLQDIAGRTTRHSYHVAMQYNLVNPDVRTRHGFSS
jgi:hypothetical protein